MGFIHRARSSRNKSVRRWIRMERSSTPLALSASVLIAGKNLTKYRPVLLRAFLVEGEPEEGEGGVLVVPPAHPVLAVDDPRLVRVAAETHLCHPRGDRLQHRLRLPSAHTMHDVIIGIALEGTARVVPHHPSVERVVHEKVRQDR